jgi:hypothetical protein
MEGGGGGGGGGGGIVKDIKVSNLDVKKQQWKLDRYRSIDVWCTLKKELCITKDRGIEWIHYHSVTAVLRLLFYNFCHVSIACIDACTVRI